jgi:hypothetical protein
MVIVMPVGSLVASLMVSVQLSSQWNEANYFFLSARMFVRMAATGRGAARAERLA